MAGGFPLGTRVELKLGDEWTDITGRVYARDPISITRGKSPDATSNDPVSCRFTLDNRDDRFSMRNPMGPYYGLLRRNIPVRVSLPANDTALLVTYDNPIAPGTSRASAPATASMAVTSSLDVRAEIDADQWWRGHLVGKYEPTDGSRDWAFGVTDGCLVLYWSETGTLDTRVTAQSRSLFDGGPAHRAVRAVLTPDDGAGGLSVSFYTAPTLAGPWTEEHTVTAAFTSVVHNGPAGIDVGAAQWTDAGGALPGRVYGAEVYANGTLVASPDFAAQTPGAATFADAQGNAWMVLDDAEITDRDMRFFGEISQWPQSRDVAEADKTIAVTAYGIRRRLDLNTPPLDSVMVREFASPKRSNIVAYWPMEDAAGATAIASAFPEAPAMRVYGAPELATYSDWHSSKPLPKMRTGSFTGDIPAYDSSTGVIQVRLFIDMDTAPSAMTNLFTLQTTTMVWRVDVGPSGVVQFKALSLDEETTYMDSGQWAYNLDHYGFVSINFLIQQNGSNVDAEFSAIDFQSDEVWNQAIPLLGVTTETVTGRKIGTAKQITVARDRTLGDVAVGHLAIANTIAAFANTGGALNTWNGEMAEERFWRLSREDGIPVRTNNHGGAVNYVNGHKLGDQVSDSWLSIVDEAEAADLGILTESRRELGFLYRNRQSLVNQAATVSLDYNAKQIAGTLEPVDDDQALTNDVTVSRSDGGSARAQDTTSPLSVLAPPGGVGPYATQEEISAQSDEWLPSQAAFRLRLGTVDEARYPTLDVNLHAPGVSDELARAVRRVDIGDRVDIVNPDAWTPSVAQIVTGYTETLQVVTHSFTFNLRPYAPWTAGVVDVDRYDTAGSELAAPATPTPTAPDFVTAQSYWVNDSAIVVPQIAAPFVVVALAWNTTAVVTPPAGWTLVKSLSATSSGAAVFTAPGDVAGWTFTLSATSKTAVTVLGYSDAEVIASNGTVDSGSDGVHEAPGLSIPDGPVRLVRFYWDKSTTTTAWTKNDINATVRATSLGTGGGATSMFATDQTAPAGTVALATATANVAANQAGGFSVALLSTAPPDGSDGSISETDTTMTVATTLGPRWTTDGEDFPFDVVVDGERMTVTAISGTDPAGQTFTVTRGVNGIQKRHAVGASVSLADPAYVTL